MLVGGGEFGGWIWVGLKDEELRGGFSWEVKSGVALARKSSMELELVKDLGKTG
jgi:hypothetical protein